MRLIAIHPPVIGSFCTLGSSDRLQHIFGYFYKVIIFVNIAVPASGTVRESIQ